MGDEKVTARELLAKELKARGFDGLFCADADCGCSVDNLAPCESCCLDCEPGYRHDRPAGSDTECPWIVSRIADPVAAWKEYDERH